MCSRRYQVICPSGRLVSSLLFLIFRKIFVAIRPKSNLELSPSRPTEGRIRIVRDAGWDVVDAAGSGVKCVRRAVFRERTAARRTYDAEAYGEVVWS